MARKRRLPEWCKSAKIAMIRQDVTTEDLVKATGYTRTYVSSIINGQMYARPAVKTISALLGISDNYS